VISCIRTRMITASCLCMIGPFTILKKKPKHARLEKECVTQDFVIGPRGAIRAPQGAQKDPKKVQIRNKK
jgi:hypothetical protein